MPKPGFKSITVTDEMHAHWSRKYKKEKKHLRTQGITSLSAYITKLLSEYEEKLKESGANA